MSGAGETRAKEFEGISSEAGSNFASGSAGVRMYWRKGMLWTVYRTGATEPRGWSGVSRRMSARLRAMGESIMRFLIQPWP
ncbi:MAG TPA: hypothetical protein VJV96_03190 [Candidatus Angelobacter sp.]|jgi:hypothetical protein|nr:hypothetical protein [Candidatus Angelobacter sp.]